MIQAKNISRCYPGEPKPAVDGLNLDVAQGEFVSILGRSGSGKSTLLYMLSSLVRPDSGEIYFKGEEIARAGEAERNRLRRAEFAMVFQQHHLLPYLSALENVMLPFMGARAFTTAAQMEAAKQMLERVGLKGKEASRPGQLSGGEQQRVAIARALVQGASVLFADEPTGSLDTATGASIFHLLQDLNRDGLTVIMVTHNPEYAAQAGRCITMEDGKIVN